LALAALLGVLCSPTAGAQCTIAAATFTFGSYDVFSATNLDSIGTLTINCNFWQHQQPAVAYRQRRRSA
jgi:Spore Coat Protein U domain